MKSLLMFLVAVGLAGAFASSKKDAAFYSCKQLCSSCRNETVQCIHYCDVVSKVLACACDKCVMYNAEEEGTFLKHNVTGVTSETLYLNTTTAKPTAEPRVNEGLNVKTAATFVTYVLVLFVLQFII